MQQGFSLLHLKRHVDAKGSVSNDFGKSQMKDLVAKAPVNVLIMTNDYSHFSIFRGMSGNRVLLADPAWGNRIMLIEEFQESWIDSHVLGHIGFAVELPGGETTTDTLSPTENDFVTLG